jgi:tetratricopeptide (TPR) repeat protein
VDEERDFFISYTGADRAWAEWIAWQLEAEGYTTVLQAWDFAPGDNFVVRMRDALERADRTVALLSPAYLASEYGTDEWTSAFLHAATGQQRLLPIRVEACQLPRLLAAIVYIDLVGLTREQARARLLEGVRRGRQRPQLEPGFPGDQPRMVAGGEPAFPGRQPKVSNLPPRNLVFTGRDELLTALHQRLTGGMPTAVTQPQALHGLGGVGKTQLALEYAHRHGGGYDLVWWVTAEQPAAIPAQLVALARRLGLPEQAEQAETIGVLFDQLRQWERWLLIFDNAEDPAELRPWWPPDSGRVLVTSRTPAWTGLAATIGVDVLARSESVAFLHHRGGLGAQEAAKLAEALGDLPLALEQAAAYLEETATSPDEYLDLLDTHARELFTLGRLATSVQTIATTWTVSLQRIRSEVAAAEDLLTLCAFLGPDSIPLALLREHPGELPDRLRAAVLDRLDLRQALGTLRRYALVTATGDTLSVHRLVQAVARHSLDRREQDRWMAVAAHLVLDAFPDQAEDPDTWPVAATLLSHGLAVINHLNAGSADPETTVRLLNRVGAYLQARTEFSQARPLLERALLLAETRLGPDDPSTALSLSNLARVLREQGELDRARALYERALAIREARLGADHPDTALSLSRLAGVLRAQGDLDRARALHGRAVAIYEARLGPDHPDTAWSLSNLANVLRDQGDLDRARTLYERALHIREARFGVDHPHIAWGVDHLAGILRDQGDLARARTLYERAVTIYEARLGADHPLTAWSLGHLASVLAEQADLASARILHERALAIREARLGADNPRTATSLNNLATVMYAQGDLDGSRALLKRALAIREARLGPHHPDTQRSRRDLAAVEAALQKP